MPQSQRPRSALNIRAFAAFSGVLIAMGMAVLDAEPEDLLVTKIAALYLFKRSGELLLQHRSEDAPNFPGYWGPFGGAAEEGETVTDAVRRELKEELEYSVRAPLLFEQYRMHYKGNDYHVHVFVEEYSGAPLTLNEGQGLGWFDVAGLENLLLNEHDISTTRALTKALADGSLAGIGS